MKKGRRRTIGHSFRVYEDLLTVLNEEAQNEGISPNAMLNHILEEYCQYNRYTRRFPTIMLGEKLFSDLITKISQEQAAEMGKATGQRMISDFMKIVGLATDYDSMIYVMKGAPIGNWFIYNHSVSKGIEVFHLRHNYGINWSIFLKEALSPLFEKVANKKPKIEISESSVTFEIPLTSGGI